MTLDQQTDQPKTIWRSEPYGGRYIDLSSGNDGRLTFSVVAVGASRGDALGSICPHEFMSMTLSIGEHFVSAAAKVEASR